MPAGPRAAVRRLCAIAVVAASLGAIGCGGEPPREDGPFAYDVGAPLDLEDRGVVSVADGIELRDLSFTTPAGRVEGLLLTPTGTVDLPAVVIGHGSGGDRTSMIAPAAWLAARGAAVLTLTLPSSSSREAGRDAAERLQWFRDTEVADVVAVRRAVDLLASREEVDAERIGYLGYSAGARTGALLSGTETRLQALALLAGGAANVEAYVSAAPEALRDELRATMSEVDPLRWIAQADGDRLLVQNAEADEVIPREAAQALSAAAPEGADVRWYEVGHALGALVYEEALDWLSERLPIDGPAVSGAPTGP